MTQKIADKFIRYLKDKLKNPRVDYQEPLTLLEGGIETHLYRFRLKNAPQEFLKPLVLRLSPQFCGTQSVVVEQTVQNELV